MTKINGKKIKINQIILKFPVTNKNKQSEEITNATIND